MKFKPKTRIYTAEAALTIMKSYCAAEDRCHQDIEQKLIAYQVSKDDRENILASLISEGFLNESRFAKSFVRGKFKINKWGRLRIVQGLSAKGVSIYCIEEGLKEIDESEYKKTLEQLIKSKIKGQENSNTFDLKTKIMRYASSKGYEQSLVFNLVTKVVDEVISEKE
jgi:regulatory protein